MRAVVLPLYLFALAWLSQAAVRLPMPLPSDAPPTEFSASRALDHLKVIAQQPHPIGSPANAEVRDYLVAQLESMGLDVEIQRTEMIYDYARNPGPTRMATVENIVTRRPGTGGDKALVLMSHYDSVPSAPGASDAGSGVTIILETLRALAHREPLANDLIAVVTDGEEAGLLGAQAFVRQHPLARDVGLVLNFEARGSGGPVFMFETSENNAGLIRGFREAAPFPVANSLSYEVYRRMPNDTDLSITKAHGLPGLNFGFIDNYFDYHTMGDNLGNIDWRSLQHGGSYALALAAHFGNADLEAGAGGDATYFNVLGFAFVSYPAWAVYPVAAIALVLFAAVLRLARRRGLADFKQVGLGFLAFLVHLVLVVLVVTGIFKAMGGGSGFDSVRYWTLFYHHKMQLVGFVLLTMAFSFAFYSGLSRWIKIWDLSLGAMAGWLLALAGLTFTMPGGSFLLAWPLILSLAAHGWVLTRDAPGDDGRGLAAILAGGLLGTLWLANITYFVYLGLGVNVPGAAMLVPALLMGLLIPAAVANVKASRGAVPALAALAGVALLVTAALTSPFDESHQKPNEVFYTLDADTGEAYWASTDDAPDPFTGELLGTEPEAVTFGEILPGTTAVMWKAPAPPAAVAPPEVDMLADETVDGQRTLRFRLRSPRRAEYVNLFFDEAAGIVSARLNGKPVKVTETDREGWWRWRYYALPPEGVDLELSVETADPVTLKVAEVAYRWPAALADEIPPRPAHMMRMPYSYSDSTVVTRTFELTAPEDLEDEPETTS